MSININKVKEEDGFYVSSGVITMKIGKFSEFKIGARKVSQINFIRGLPWKICVKKNEKFLQYFLQCNAESHDGNWACHATAILKMIAQKEGKADNVRGIKHTFHAKDNIWGFAEFVSSEALMNPENGWYDEATDSIILSTEINAGLPHGIETQCRMSEDLCLFENREQYSDCILVSSDGVKFNAYKGILACRSPVFAAMFQTNMVELQNGIVQIEDIKSDVLEQMLLYIYSGPNFSMKNMAEELLIASEKYQLIRLKMLCEHELAHCLNNENACALLVLASQYSAKHLKEKTIEYIQKHANEVTETEGWQILLKGDYEEFVHQIVKAIIGGGNE